MSETFICVSKNGCISDEFDTLEDAQRFERQDNFIAGIIRIVVENGKIKHCHEVGSVDH